MSGQSRIRDYSVHGVVSDLSEHLRAYIEAQYHIRDALFYTLDRKSV